MDAGESLLNFDNGDLDHYASAKEAKASEGQGTIASSVFNLTNTILGSGTLAVAYACYQSGWVTFVILMVIMAILSHIAVVLIFKTVKILNFRAGQTITYGILGKELYGRAGELVAEWSVTLQQLGACIGYVVIIGEVFDPIVSLADPNQDFYVSEWFVQLIIVMFIIFPLCLLRNMNALKFTSLVAIVCILLAALTLAIYGFTPSLNSPVEAEDATFGTDSDAGSCGEIRAGPSGLTVLAALPVFSFSFLCHQNTFPIYEELKNATVKRMSIISALSMVLAVVTYLLAGVGGYFAFADGTLDDIFLNFNTTPGDGNGTAHSGLADGCKTAGAMAYIMDVVRVGFGIALVFSYPVVVYEARRNLGFLCCSKRMNPQTHSLGVVDNFILNLCIVGGTAAVGIGVGIATESALSYVIDLVGSTCSPTMVFILPALFFLKATKNLSGFGCERAIAYVLVTFGAILIPVCVVLWVLNVSCGVMAPPQAEFCFTLGLLQNITAINTTSYV